MSRRERSGQQLGRLGRWGLHHQVACSTTLARLREERFSTLLVVLTIGVALALPGLLHVGADRLGALTDRWDSTPRINVFLDPATAEARADELAQWPEIASLRFQSAEGSLRELAEVTGSADLLDDLLQEFSANPLPAVAVLTPQPDHLSPAAMQALAERLGNEAGVEGVQVDLEWLQRLQAGLQLADRLAWGLGLLLAGAVLLVVGSLTRMAVAQRADEIRVLKLVGGSQPFVLRPFLYQGALLGVAGGVAACLLLALILWFLGEPVAALARRYGSDFRLGSVPPVLLILLPVAGALLGWLAARFSARHQLRRIEP